MTAITRSCGVGLAAALTLFCAPSASAVTVNMGSSSMSSNSISINDFAGVPNTVLVDRLSVSEVRVSDAAGALPQAGCIAESPTSVLCKLTPAQEVASTFILAGGFLGSGDDLFALTDQTPFLTNVDIHADAGNDRLIVNPGAPNSGLGDTASLWGGEGDDEMTSSTAINVLTGEGGNDSMSTTSGGCSGGQGDDVCTGGDGEDDFTGGAGDDRLFGNGGNDDIGMGKGNDLCRGGAGNDVCTAGQGNDVSFGEAGNDRVWGFDGRDRCSGGPGRDISEETCERRSTIERTWPSSRLR